MTKVNNKLKSLFKSEPDAMDNIGFNSWLLEIAFQIIKLRKARGMSQSDFAHKLGVSQSVVAKIESGQNMKCSTLWKIASVFDIELNIFNAKNKSEYSKLFAYVYDFGGYKKSETTYNPYKYNKLSISFISDGAWSSSTNPTYNSKTKHFINK